ncbi:MAG: cytochrome c-type biogenesis protein CcmH [Acidobacteriota bacterium]|jgi:cytochrome c-type biogenesis protein CcmH|nr:cytochrome c-type biogenesis protein CcmH [Acidobacteriota bacterium]
MTRGRFFRILIIAVFMIPAIPAAYAAAAQNPAVSMGPANAALVRDIENNLIAPCCWTQPISEHPSEISDLMRAEIRQMVEQGKSRKEILDYYVVKYGERILAAPRAGGINTLAYIAPAAALILGGWSLFLFGGKRRVRPAATAADSLPQPGSGGRYDDIIEKELRDLDD